MWACLETCLKAQVLIHLYIKVVLNVNYNHNHGFLWSYMFIYIYTQLHKRKIMLIQVSTSILQVSSEACANWTYPSYVLSPKSFQTSPYENFHLSPHILQNSHFLFHTNHSCFLHAYLYRQKGFEQGSVQGYLGIWGEFQFHVELIRGQLWGVEGEARWSCGRWNHTLRCFLRWPQHR